VVGNVWVTHTPSGGIHGHIHPIDDILVVLDKFQVRTRQAMGVKSRAGYLPEPLQACPAVELLEGSHVILNPKSDLYILSADNKL